MILKKLRLTSFKNHSNNSFEFGKRINCVLGKNGKGKTNLLDAIYYLSFSKSGLGSHDRFSTMHGKPAFTIFGEYDELTTAIQYIKGKSKILKIDGAEPERLSDIIGRVLLVMVLPNDTSMIMEGSDLRRKFFDGALSQFDLSYLESLLKYNKVLKQRNSLLKQTGGQVVNHALLETYDDQLIPLAQKISSERNALNQLFEPYLQKNYKELHDNHEVPKMNFKTHVDQDFVKRFKSSFQKDQMMQRTLLGSHKDDYEFILDDEPIKKFGSQGQQKTFTIALKLGLYDFLMKKTGKKPLLLLDDIFDKLDDSRIQLLVSLLKDGDRFGQIFITDARKDRSKALFKNEKGVNFIEIN
ncbi:MAG: DNA replication and repair protein RecF [Bacteroidota bacterium]